MVVNMSSLSELDWAGLPEDLLYMILDNLVSFSDYVCFGAVCKPWQSVAMHNKVKFIENKCCRQVPLLLVPSKDNSDERRSLYSITHKKLYDLQLRIPYQKRLSGSSRGWLITTEESFALTLVNPFSGAVIELPIMEPKMFDHDSESVDSENDTDEDEDSEDDSENDTDEDEDSEDDSEYDTLADHVEFEVMKASSSADHSEHDSENDTDEDGDSEDDSEYDTLADHVEFEVMKASSLADHSEHDSENDTDDDEDSEDDSEYDSLADHVEFQVMKASLSADHSEHDSENDTDDDEDIEVDLDNDTDEDEDSEVDSEYATLADHVEFQVMKASLSADPALSPDDYIVFAIYSDVKRLAYIRAGDKAWTFIDKKRFTLIHDVIYYKGKIYAVDFWCRIIMIDVNSRDEATKETQVKVISPKMNYMGVYRTYLVESSSGDLLLVQKFLEIPSNGSEYRFKVFKFLLDQIEQGVTDMFEVKSLDGDTLFLGDNHSICISASKWPGCQPNSIYYTDDCNDHNLFCNGHNLFPRRGWRDMGIFKVEDGSFGTHYILDASHNHMPPSIWILPTVSMDCANCLYHHIHPCSENQHTQFSKQDQQ